MQPPDVYGGQMIQKPPGVGTPQMQKENIAQGGGGDFERDGGSGMPQ